MQDDTGQPTVDRLAALEAVAKASRKLMDERKAGSATLILNMAALVEALAALDAAPPLTGPVSDRIAPNTNSTTDKAVATTPTSDQGALERARIALRRGAKPGNPIPTCRCFKVDMARNCVGVCEEAAEHVAAALAAAASETRAAERVRIAQRVSERCILRLQVDRDPVEEANRIIQDLAYDIETDWADYEDDDAELRALATPAQSET